MTHAITAMPKYESYKDSGFEPMGDIPEHWGAYPLCAKAELKSISNRENEELLSVYLDKGVIRFSDVEAKRTNVTSQDLSNYQLVEPGDFVLNNQQAWRGSVGVSKYEGIVSPAYLILKLSKDINPNYANYLFRDSSMVSHYLMNSKGVGTIQRNLYWPSFKRSSLFLPPLKEQQAIAKFLDKKTAQIDEAIRIKERQIALLKERKQIIIQNAVTKGLDPNAPMKDSGFEWLGSIPEHWEIKKIKHYLKIKNGQDHKEVVSDDGQYPVFGSGGEFAKADDYLYRGDAILMGRKGTIDKPLHVDCAFWTVDTMFYGIPNNKCNTQFLYFSITQMPFAYYLTSTALPSMTQFDLNNNPVAIPPSEDQVAIVKYIENKSEKIDAGISAQQAQIEKLKEYKTSLINSAVTGKIKVI